jgi:hypothetical protein
MKLAKRQVASEEVLWYMELDVNALQFDRGIYSTHNLSSEYQQPSHDPENNLHYTQPVVPEIAFIVHPACDLGLTPQNL